MTQDFQREKDLVRAFYAALDHAEGDDVAAVLARYCAPDLSWHGFHPFNDLLGPQDVARKFYVPLKSALTSMQRRMDIFIAGRNHCDDGASVWVASMGHFMGLFDAPWLAIRPSRKLTMLRYGEFHKIEGDTITETALFFDIPHLMAQAGQNPFPPATAAHLVQPGPMTHDGLCFGPSDLSDGAKTMQVINQMIGDIKTWSGGRKEPLVDELRRSWNEDMIWWGPAGIGATYTIERYAQQHSGPFRAAFKERKFNGHIARIAEGHFGGFFGWPNLTLEHVGGFMGMAATGMPADMRVIDMYRRDGDKLTENWVFIDLLHFWKQQGVDILARATAL